MGFKEKLIKVYRLFFPKEEKRKNAPGTLGHYNSKPFHNFKYALIYAGEKEIFNNEKVEIYTRTYKETIFVNVLVNDEEGFDISKHTFDNIEPLLKQNNIEKPKNTIVFVLFQHRNDNTIAMCKKFCNSNKYNFEQAVIYNPVDVQMDFYKSVPKFYKLYDHFCENLYFDLAFIDDKRE